MKKNVGISYKAFAVILVAVLVLGGTIGGTMAWLIDEHDPVTNTFTESDISITLKETTGDYKMVPGHIIAKDPKITVSEKSEDCYVFVKVDKLNNYDSYLEHAIADGWTLLEEGSNVYYRVVKTADTQKTFSVLANDQVKVKDTVTKEMMETAKSNQPKLTFTAYAVQLNKNNTETFTAAEAWDNATAIATSDN